MDHMVPRQIEPSIDLESGGGTTTSEEEEEEEEGTREPGSGGGGGGGGVRQAKKLLGRVWSGFVSFDGSLKGEEEDGGLNSTKNRSITPPENTEFFIDNKKKQQPEGGKEIAAGLSVKKPDKEKRKSTSAKKPPKPPRPPRGPSLDAADQKLIREISELAMLKRARVERMKAQKKMKAAKAASSNSNMCAMLITVVFCLVIIFQGMSSRGSSRLSFQGSPQSAMEMKGPLISVQYYKTPSGNGTDGPGSASPGLVEQVSGSGPNEEGIRVAG